MSEESDLELGKGKTCFIVSPIGNSLAPLGSPGRANYEQSIMMWSKVFEPACAQFGLTAIRADKIATPGEIPDQIFKHLRDAEVVIADLSAANPNVMYELGLRHSRSSITVHVGEYERLPFDVSTIRTIQFVRDEAGLIEVRQQLIESLRAALETGTTELRASALFAATTPADVVEDARKSAQPDEATNEPDEPGLVEVLAEAEAAVHHISEVLGDGTEQIQLIGAITEDASAEISGAESFAQRLLVSQKLAKSLAEPSSELERLANEFFHDVERIDVMVRFVVERVRSGEEDTPELREYLDSLLKLVDVSEESLIGITAMRDGTSVMKKSSSTLKGVADVIARALNRQIEGIRGIQQWRPLIEEIDS